MKRLNTDFALHVKLLLISKNGSAGASAEVGFKFQSLKDSGAFVMLDVPGKSREIESKRHIITYMRKHFDSWLEYANSEGNDGLGLGIEENEIIFVCGTVKTTRWTVVAFQNSSARKMEGHVKGDIGDFAGVEFSINKQVQTFSGNHYRSGPSSAYGQVMAVQDAGASDAIPAKASQCIFVHYYKMRRRILWPFKAPMRAAAGPHNLPPGPGDQGFADEMLVDEMEGSDYEPERVTSVGEVSSTLFVLRASNLVHLF